MQDLGSMCQSRIGGVPAGVAPGYRHHLGPKDSSMAKETEKRWQKMHGKKGARQYDSAAAAACPAGEARPSPVQLSSAQCLRPHQPFAYLEVSCLLHACQCIFSHSMLVSALMILQ